MQLIFILWLDSKGLLARWIECTLVYRGQFGYSPLSFLNYVKAYDLLSYSFQWSETNEGNAFWNGINSEWKQIVKEVRK